MKSQTQAEHRRQVARVIRHAGRGDAKPGDELAFHLSVSDAKKAHAALKSRGGKFACDLVSSDDGGVFCMVQDPHGNRFKIVQAQH